MCSPCEKFSPNNPIPNNYHPVPLCPTPPQNIAITTIGLFYITFILGSLHDNEIGSSHSPLRKALTCTLLAIGTLCNTPFVLAEGITKLALTILASPLFLFLLCSSRRLQNVGYFAANLGLSSLVSFVGFAFSFPIAFQTVFTNKLFTQD